MPTEFYIAVDLVAGLGVVGLIVWWLARRQQWRHEPVNVPFKAVLSLVAIALLIAFSRRIGFSYGGAFAVPFACLAIGVVLSIAWAPHVGEWLARPLTALLDGGSSAPEPQPLYSIAIAKRKKGQFNEAVFAIHEQLKKFPNDVTGQMMLAEIQAENLNDLPGAEVTIQRLCAQSGHAPQAIALALTGLADWQLKYGQDVEAARASFEAIIERLPETEQARLAAIRIAHLGTTERLLASRERETIHVRAGVANVGLRQESASLRPAAEDPAARAAEYIKHLEQHPLDSEVREKLAMIYAEHYQRVDLAADQLEQLLQQPTQPAKQQAHWLNLLASLHIEHGGDLEKAREALQRIIDLHPGSALASLAEQRLAHLKLDVKAKEEGRVLKMGSYDQNIGLNKPKPKNNG